MSQWKRGGFGHDLELAEKQAPGSLALFCPACPQPGVNLPEDWDKEENAQWKYSRVICMDGNFKADHIKMDTPDDVFLSDGLAYCVGKDKYKEHLRKSKNSSEVLVPFISRKNMHPTDFPSFRGQAAPTTRPSTRQTQSGRTEMSQA